MICNRLESGWEVIYQRAHALLAAKLLAALKPDCQQRWLETLNAAAQHDHGWQEWESVSPLTEAGEPRSFLQTSVDESLQQARRAVERARHQSLWGGLLVARHVTYLYERREEPPLVRLVDELREARAKWRELLEVPAAEEEAAYEFVLWGDTLSLLLCLRGDHPLSGTQPVLRGKAYELSGDGERRSLHPWPYPVAQLEVSVEAYYLNSTNFDSQQALSQAMAQAPMRRLTWELLPASTGQKQPANDIRSPD